MIAHVVTFNWCADVTSEQIAAVYREHQALATKVQGLAEFHFGPNLAVVQNTADYAVVAVAEDVDGLQRYLDHPDHVALVQQYTSRMLSARNAVQIQWA